MLYPSNDMFTSSARCSPRLRHATPHIQKLIYAIVLARRKLRHYFKSQPVTMVSSFPLGEIIHNQEASGRISKWSVELMGEALSFAPRKAIKS